MINIPEAVYVDLPSRLQNAALANPLLYNDSDDGHPNMGGYDFIAQTIASYTRHYLPIRPFGLVVADHNKGKIYYVIHNGKLWIFTSEKILIGNGWDPNRATPISKRFIDNLPIAGVVTSINPNIYGPSSSKFK